MSGNNWKKMFVEKIMKQTNTELVVGNENYGLVNIRRGIFQGYPLSPLLFVIARIHFQ